MDEDEPQNTQAGWSGDHVGTAAVYAGSLRLPFLWSESTPVVHKSERALASLQLGIQVRRASPPALQLVSHTQGSAGVVLAECQSWVITCELGHDSGLGKLVPCLSTLMPHITLTVASPELPAPATSSQPAAAGVPSTPAGAASGDQPARKRAKGVSGTQAAREAAHQRQTELLQSRGLVWVKVGVLLQPSMFVDTTADPSDLPPGAAVVQLLRHYLRPFHTSDDSSEGSDAPQVVAVPADDPSSSDVVIVGSDSDDSGSDASIDEQPLASRAAKAGHRTKRARSGKQTSKGSTRASKPAPPVKTKALKVEQPPAVGFGVSGDEGTWVPEDRATQHGHNVHEEVFEIARPIGWTAELPDPPGLKCTLYRYQRRALAWMAWREGVTGAASQAAQQHSPQQANGLVGTSQDGGAAAIIPATGDPEGVWGAGAGSPVGRSQQADPAAHAVQTGDVEAARLAGAGSLVDVSREQFQQALQHVQAPAAWPADGRVRLMWTPLALQSGEVIWMDHDEGLVAHSLPDTPVEPLLGGMLCDEMGLGKTVEVIALMLANPAPQAPANPQMRETIQPDNEQGGQPEPDQRPPGPTLIVTPNSILQQWVGEIKKHSNLKVEEYQGLQYLVSEARVVRQRALKFAESEVRRMEKKLKSVEKQLLRVQAEDAYGGDDDAADMPAWGRRRGRRRARAPAARGRGRRMPAAGARAAGAPAGSDADGPDAMDARQPDDAIVVSDSSDAEGEGHQNSLASRKAKLLRAKEEAAEAVRDAEAAARAAVAALDINEDEVREEELSKMMACDVVVVNYNVLAAEVHLTDAGPSRQLRYEKKYKVPVTPLRALSWHRLVLDEAQMVGAGLTNVAIMASALTAKHRWCVTGTPIGVGGLRDIQGALAALCYAPLDQPRNFWRLVVLPYLSGSQDGYKRLQLALKPIMWRNSKAVAAQDLTLPPRSLRNALLAMHPAERAFYQHVLEQARKANAEWVAHQTASELALVEDIQETAQESRKRQGYNLKLSRQAMAQLLQLRLACVHPQLTDYWMTLRNELQLGQGQGQGGALSITEMLSRMRDQAQLHLQNEERDFCQLADALAGKLLKMADRIEPLPDPEDGSQPGTSKKQSKKRKRAEDAAAKSASKAAADRQVDNPLAEDGPDMQAELGDADQPAPVDEYLSPTERATRLRKEALDLLETSYRVGELGIDAATLPGDEDDKRKTMEMEDGLDDIVAGAASWRAWRLVQIRTCHLLAEHYTALGRHAEAEAMRRELGEKEVELQETVDVAIAKGETQLASLRLRVTTLTDQSLPETWEQAVEAGFPMSYLEGDLQTPLAWVEGMRNKWEAARAQEAANRAAQKEQEDYTGQEVLLGTEVAKLISSEDSRITILRQHIEGLYGSRCLGQARERVQEALQVWSQQQRVGRQAPDAVRASATWCADFSLDKAVTQRTVMNHVSSRQSAQAALEATQGWLVPCGDTLGMASLRRWLNNMTNRLKTRQANYHDQDADGRARSVLGHVSEEALYKALEALRLQVELLRSWREIHVAALKLEIETHNKALVKEEAAAAAAGENLGLMPAKYTRLTLSELREKCDELKRSCEELRHRKAYLDHQLREALGGDGGEQPPEDAPAGPQPPRDADVEPPSDAARDTDTLDAAVPERDVGTVQLNSATETEHAQDARPTVADSNNATHPAAATSHPQAEQTGAATSTGASRSEGKLKPPADRPASHRPPCTCGGTYKRGTGISAVLHSWGECSCGTAHGANKARHAAGRPIAVNPDVNATAGTAHVEDMAIDTDPASTSAQQAAVQQAPGHGAQQEAAGAGISTQPQDLVHHIDLTTEVIDLTDEPLAARLQRMRQHSQLHSEHGHREQHHQQRRQSNPGPNVQVMEIDVDEENVGAKGGSTNVDCSVCLNTLNEGDPLMVYPCGHYFCADCSEEILSVSRAKCPNCRRDVARGQVFRVVASRGSTGPGRHNPEVAPPEGPRVLEMKFVGSWMTKLEGLLRRLVLMRTTAPDEKALVFSQFPAALELVSKALTVNNVGHVSLTGGSKKGRGAARDAVARFNTDSSVHVFLLSLQQGAAGLTLVRANHVFMLDVSTDPAVEQQAVARVHRIGQTRPVTITRLLCDGTVEMQVLEALEQKQHTLVQDDNEVHVEGEEEEDTLDMQDEPTLDALTASHLSGGQDLPVPAGLAEANTSKHHQQLARMSQLQSTGLGVVVGGGVGSPLGRRTSQAGARGGPGAGGSGMVSQTEAPALASGPPKKETLGMDEAAKLLAML